VNSVGDWPWCSLAKRRSNQPPGWLLPLDHWPVKPASNWNALVGRPQTAAEVESLRLCVRRGRPYGDEQWQQRTSKRLGLESTFRPRGRQRIRPVRETQRA
jgi:putative transposase